MKYRMPTPLFEERDCVKNHAEDLASLGGKALIVTGRHSAAANGSLSDVQEALNSQGVSYAVFSEIEENPSVETVMKARDFGLAEEVDFCIGIGGGSPMDAAKAIALMIRNKDEGADYLYEAGNPVDFLPVVCIPTTCGTGSEVTGVSVLTRHDKETKASIPYSLFPDLALLDPKYLEEAPASVLHNTACDALCHLCESLLNRKADDYSRMPALAGLDIWSRSLPLLKGEREAEPGDYGNLLRASALGGMAIAQTGTAVPHALSYGLTYDLGIAHGRACGQFLGGYLAAAPEELRREILGRSGLRTLQGYDEYFEKSVGSVSMTEEEKIRIYGRVVTNPGKLATAPFDVTEDILHDIVWKAYST